MKLPRNVTAANKDDTFTSIKLPLNKQKLLILCAAALCFLTRFNFCSQIRLVTEVYLTVVLRGRFVNSAKFVITNVLIREA